MENVSAGRNYFSVVLFFRVVLVAGSILGSACSDSNRSSIIFEDVAFASGLPYEGMTFGAAWGDFDKDEYPDLYLNNHLNESSLYRNLGNGQFEDVSAKYFLSEDLTGDSHGAAWGDFDNDGDLDLVQLTGAVNGVGTEAKQLFLNEDSQFKEIAKSAGVANFFGRTRMPLWFDANGDGRLDLFQGALARHDDKLPPFWFLQGQGDFREGNDIAAFASRSVPFCIITQLTDDNKPELVCRLISKQASYQIFSTATRPFKALDLLYNTAFWDIAAGDFNGDLSMDLYLARKMPGGSVVLGNRRETQILADLKADKSDVGNAVGIQFRTTGNVIFDVLTAHSRKDFSVQQIYIGSQGLHPAGYSFELSSDVRDINGLASYQKSEASGLYIGQISPDKWQVLLVGKGGVVAQAVGVKPKYDNLSVRVTSTHVIDELESAGPGASESAAPDRLFMNEAGVMREQSNEKGVNASISASVNVVAGDFDNDMDLDLYIVASDEINNHENVLFLNDGEGNFEKVANAGGAPGGNQGVGESVVLADYDMDGFLDLLVVNGASMGRSFGLHSEGGGYHLYRNAGNTNHWLEIDLQGTRSNRDGVGAVVYINAGGVTQVRMQDGGIHNRGQNHQRLHYGLGVNTNIDSIVVHWPSGVVQELNDVQADQLIKIRELPDSSFGKTGKDSG